MSPSVVIVAPTIARLNDLDPNQVLTLKMLLTYKDEKVAFAIQKHKHSTWYASKYGAEAWKEKLVDLQADLYKSLFFEDAKGFWTYSGLAFKAASILNCPVLNEVTYPEYGALGFDKKPYERYPFQERIDEELLKVRHGGVEVGCHRRGERVLMVDGTTQAVESVRVGEFLMGPDSIPRRVEELRSGRDTMYLVETINGQKMYVNGHHLLVLERTRRSGKAPSSGRRYTSFKGDHPRVVVSVEEYLTRSPKFKHLYKMFSVGVEFQPSQVLVDPYFVGVLLGDGSVLNSIGVTTADPEIVKCVEDIAKIYGLRVRPAFKLDNLVVTYFLSGHTFRNPLITDLRTIGIWGMGCEEKSVPLMYLRNSRLVRLQVLAGLLDTDGSLIDGCYDFVSKSPHLASDCAFLARSLGMRVRGPIPCQKSDQNGTVGEYHRIYISGNIDEIPVRIPRKKARARRQKKSPNRFGFTVTKVSDNEEYFGFVLDRDHLYLTDTFLVTHNTGLGKSLALEYLTKEIGLKTVIMAPSKDIARRLYDDCLKAFGLKKVGFYGDGTKKASKLITVAIAASLTRIDPNSPDGKLLSSAQVFIADESHLCPATTLAKVCFGLMKDAPYRFFFSATQLRNDGLDLLLDAITGPIVYRMTVKEGIEQGYLAALEFYMVNTSSSSTWEGEDPNEQTREHLYYNEKVIRQAAHIANNFASRGLRVLILVEELEQFGRLYPHLKHVVKFAHGGVNADNAIKIPKIFHDSDPTAFVKEFNAGKIPILVGTSCISTGTDVKANEATIYLQGGKSEIQTMQGPAGRSTRLFDLPWANRKKTTCKVVDFDVQNCEVTHRHAVLRREIYRHIAPVQELIYE